MSKKKPQKPASSSSSSDSSSDQEIKVPSKVTSPTKAAANKMDASPIKQAATIPSKAVSASKFPKKPASSSSSDSSDSSDDEPVKKKQVGAVAKSAAQAPVSKVTTPVHANNNKAPKAVPPSKFPKRPVSSSSSDSSDSSDDEPAKKKHASAPAKPASQTPISKVSTPAHVTNNKASKTGLSASKVVPQPESSPKHASTPKETSPAKQAPVAPPKAVSASKFLKKPASSSSSDSSDSSDDETANRKQVSAPAKPTTQTSASKVTSPVHANNNKALKATPSATKAVSHREQSPKKAPTLKADCPHCGKGIEVELKFS